MSKRGLILTGVLMAWPFALGCEEPAAPGAGGGPSVEELTAKLQGKKEEATPTGQSQPGENANTSPENTPENAASPTASGGEQAIAQKASDRPQMNTQGGYAGAVFGASRSIRITADDLAWKKSVQLFEAEHGRKPKDTEEFMERIKSEGTPLPDIAPGTKYLYMPEGQFGELYQVPIDEPAGNTPAEGGQ